MQLEIGMSMSRYLPATGTAGLDRDRVSGNSREPRPPPRMRARTERMGVEPRGGPGTCGRANGEAGRVTGCYQRAGAGGSGSRGEVMSFRLRLFGLKRPVQIARERTRPPAQKWQLSP